MSTQIDDESPTTENMTLDGELLDANAMGDSVLPMSLNNLDNLPPAVKVPAPRSTTRHSLDMMADVPITLVFEVGRLNITIKQLMELSEGSYVDLRNMAVDSIDVRVNDKLIAQAETIALPQRYGIRFGEVEAFSMHSTGEIDDHG